MMNDNHPSRQPVRVVWSRERLVHEHAIALGNAMDKSTLSNYNSALNSYLTFVKSHDFPVEPTPETLSFFTVFMCHHINPQSVNTYLSGIVQQLENFFLTVREARNSILVRRTLQGCMRIRGTATVRKHTLTIDDLHTVVNHFHNSSSHNELLFVAMLQTGFFGVMRLGELSFPDNASLRNWKKVIRRKTIKSSQTQYEFLLPGHKADRFYEGKVTALLFWENISPTSHYVTSQNIYIHETDYIPYHRHYGSQRQEISLRGHFSCHTYASSF